MLVASDLGRAKEVYFEQYLPARKVNMALVDRALEVASEEAATASRYVDTTAARTQSYAWLAVGLFVLLGAAAGMGLSRAVGTIARDFEGAAQEVWRQRDHMQAVYDRDARCAHGGGRRHHPHAQPGGLCAARLHGERAHR